jgi:cyclic pyranopterin phosphate synthase
VTRVVLGIPRLRSGNADRRALPGDRPTDARLIDRFGRAATDLRVSLTDRCNLRCSYCMPPEGLGWKPDERLLTDDELIRLITIAVQRLGVEEVRFTGGEPLLRKGLERILGATTALRTASGATPQTAVTTNGLGLAGRAAGLAASGLRRVNVSLDSLDRARFAWITHRDRLDDVLAGLSAATAAGLSPVKVNAVLIRDVNDDEAVPLLRWALQHGYHLRFIEQMPLDPHRAWDRTAMVTAAEILAKLQTAFRLEPADPATRGAAPAESWLIDAAEPAGVVDTGQPAGAVGSGDLLEADGRGNGVRRGRVGIVASVTRPFCGNCDRTRLTADGQVRSCLFTRSETDLQGPLRSGASDDEIADIWRGALWTKEAGHGIDDPSFVQPDRPMSAIGG